MEDVGQANVKIDPTDYLTSSPSGGVPTYYSIYGNKFIASGANGTTTDPVIYINGNYGSVYTNSLLNPTGNVTGFILLFNSGVLNCAVWGNNLGAIPLYPTSAATNGFDILDPPYSVTDLTGQASPGVLHAGMLFVSRGSPYNITSLSSGRKGQFLTIYNQSATAITVKNGTNLALAGSADVVLTGIGYSITLSCLDGVTWVQVGTRSP